LQAWSQYTTIFSRRCLSHHVFFGLWAAIDLHLKKII